MWHLSPHCHSLLRLYRFYDLKAEGLYCDEGRQWCRIPVQLHSVVLLIHTLNSLFSTSGFPPGPPRTLPLAFWIYLTIALLSVLVLVCIQFSSVVRHRIIPLFSSFCCVLALCYSYLMFQQPRKWQTDALMWWSEISIAPSVTTLPDGIQEFLGKQYGSLAVHLTFLQTILQYMVLALIGLNWWTLGAFVVTLGLLILGMLVDPLIPDADIVSESITALTMTVAFAIIALVLERVRRSNFLSQTLLARELQSSQMADSILNHTLKNTLADVSANIELFLAGGLGLTFLEDSLACLQRGIRSCKERQVFLKLVSGEYTPIYNVFNVRTFMQQLVAGRNVVCSAVDFTIYLDCALCGLILDNALSNAFKHGCPDNPDVRLSVQDVSAHAAEELLHGWRRLLFTVRNAANPLRPRLTVEDARRLLSGEAAPLSNIIAPTLSDRVGMQHCVLAARLAKIELSMQQLDGEVVFGAMLDVEEVPDTQAHSEGAATSTVGDFPDGLHYCCIDDSSAARRLLDFHLTQWCNPAAVRTFGAQESDVELFLCSALELADVVIIDQHLEFSCLYYGTELVAQLLDRGFQGFICIRSANDTAQDKAMYLERGAHCSIGKDVPGPKMVEQLKAAYVQTFAPRDSGRTSIGSAPFSPVEVQAPLITGPNCYSATSSRYLSPLNSLLDFDDSHREDTIQFDP